MNFALFERERLFKSKRNLFFVLFLFASAIYFVILGVGDYRKMQERRELLLSIEDFRLKNYTNYTQYAGLGFRMFSQPSPMYVFFNSNGFFTNSYSNIDSSQIVNILKDVTGRNLFSNAGFADFGGLIHIFAGLYCVWLGASLLKHRCKKRSGRQLVFIRFVYILALFFFLHVICYCIVFIFFHDAILKMLDFTIFTLYSLLYLSFFYFLGVCCFNFFRKARVFIALILWFVLVFVLPQFIQTFASPRNLIDSEYINKEKFERLMIEEQKFVQSLKEVRSDSEKAILLKQTGCHILNTVFFENSKIEFKYNVSIKNAIHSYRKWMCFLPTTFLSNYSNDLSGAGYIAYLDFVEYISKVRNGFVPWVIDKRYKNPGHISSYIQRDDAVFKQQFQFTGYHFVGFCFTLLLTIGMMLPLFIRTRPRKMQVIEKGILPLEKTTKAKFYFIFSRKQADLVKIFEQAESIHAPIIRRINPEEYDTGTCLRSWLWFHCRLLGADFEAVVKLLAHIDQIKERMDEDVSKLSDEELNLCWLVVNLRRPSPNEIYYMDNFLLGFTKSGEAAFRDLYGKIRYLITLIYVGREMYDSQGVQDVLEPDGLDLIAIPPERITLR